MGFLDDAKKKLGDAVDKHGDKVGEGLDKAGNLIDEKTGGKHSDKIASGVDKAKGALDDLDGQRDDIPGSSTPAPPAEPRHRSFAPDRADGTLRPRRADRPERADGADRPDGLGRSGWRGRRRPPPGADRPLSDPAGARRRPGRGRGPWRPAGHRGVRVNDERGSSQDPSEQPEPDLDAPPDPGPGGPADWVEHDKDDLPLATPTSRARLRSTRSTSPTRSSSPRTSTRTRSDGEQGDEPLRVRDPPAVMVWFSGHLVTRKPHHPCFHRCSRPRGATNAARPCSSDARADRSGS